MSHRKDTSHRLTSSSAGLPIWEFDNEQGRKMFSRVDDRLDSGMSRLDALREEAPDGSIIDLEPGEIRRLMPPSSSNQNWVNSIPATEQAVITRSARPQLVQMEAHSQIPISNSTLITQERPPRFIAAEESTFLTIEPYDQSPQQPNEKKAQSAAAKCYATPFSAPIGVSSYRTLDSHKEIHSPGVNSQEEEDDTMAVAIRNSLQEMVVRQPAGDSITMKSHGLSKMQECQEEDEIAAAIKESMKNVALTGEAKGLGVEKRSSKSDPQGWDEDEIAAAIRQSSLDTKTSQRCDGNTFARADSYVTHQKRELEQVALRKRGADDAVRRLEALNDAARRERDAEDNVRRQRYAEDAARRKREADAAAREHDARMCELEYATELRKHEIAVQTRQAEHAAKLHDLKLTALSRELAGTAEARDAESARKLRAKELEIRKRFAEEKIRLEDERSQLEDEKRKTKSEMAAKRREEVLASRLLAKDRAARRGKGKIDPLPTASSSVGDCLPPPYSPWSDQVMTSSPAVDRGHPSQTSKSTAAVMPPLSSMSQVPAMSRHSVPQAATTQQQTTLTQSAPSSKPIPEKSSTQRLSYPTHNPSSSSDIYRPPRRMSSIMPDNITRIQQHYRFRRSLIERNVQEGRRTSDQGQAALACLTRNEVADVDSEPRRTQELNVIGLEAFEADIELLDRLGGDQMAPPVPWAIPSLEAASRGNYNQAHLRKHIEDLLAQQDANIAASSSTGSIGLGSSSIHSGARPRQFGAAAAAAAAAFHTRGAEYYEWYEEYQF